VFRAQASPPTDLNDSGLHLAMTKWASARLGDGHNPFDGWFPYLGLGFPQTHHYQSLPHVLTGAVGIVLGVTRAYHWSLYLLLAGWPVAIYAGARMVGMRQWAAAGAAVLAPWLVSEPGYGYEAGSYTWQGLGIWPQLWAAWLLPIAIGLAWRAVRGKTHPAWAGVALAACALCHFITGWLALAIVVLLPLLEGRELLRRFGRLGVLLASSAAAVAWFVVPLFLDRAGADYTGYQRGSFWYDSFGARKVLQWMVSGELLDAGRLPIVTLLAAIGLGLTVHRARTHAGSRVVLLVTLLSLVLFFGRPTLGPIADLLPYGRDLFFPRLIIGVQLGGLLLAGVAVDWLGHRLLGLFRWLGPEPLAVMSLVVTGLVVLAPVLRDGVRDEDRGRDFISDQHRADALDRRAMVDLLTAVRGEPGRVYAGTSSGWGSDYGVGYVPAHALLLEQEVDGIGYLLRVSSPPTESEARFDDTDPVQLRMFGIRWMLLPSDRRPPEGATLVAERGDNCLWLLDGPDGDSGYAQVVDGVGPIIADDGESLAAVVAESLRSGALTADSRPLIRWRGRSASPTTVTGLEGSPGSVGVPIVDPANGRFTFQVHARRNAYVALAASWHPRWQATIDGVGVDVAMIAPGVVATRVGPGTHAVTFRYVPFPYTWVLVLLGGAAFLTIWQVRLRLQIRGVASNGPLHGPHGDA
jgi:hypothetical protein